MYPYETNDDIPNEIWDIVDAFFDKDDIEEAIDNWIEDRIELGY